MKWIVENITGKYWLDHLIHQPFKEGMFSNVFSGVLSSSILKKPIKMFKLLNIVLHYGVNVCCMISVTLLHNLDFLPCY